MSFSRSLAKKFIAHIFVGRYKRLRSVLKLVLHTNLSSYQELVSLYQTATTKY